MEVLDCGASRPALGPGHWLPGLTSHRRRGGPLSGVWEAGGPQTPLTITCQVLGSGEAGRDN